MASLSKSCDWGEQIQKSKETEQDEKVKCKKVFLKLNMLKESDWDF